MRVDERIIVRNKPACKNALIYLVITAAPDCAEKHIAFEVDIEGRNARDLSDRIESQDSVHT